MPMTARETESDKNGYPPACLGLDHIRSQRLAKAVRVWNACVVTMDSMPVKSVAQHVTQARKAQNPALPDNISRCKSFVRVRVEVPLARSQQAHRLAGKSRLNDHRSQAEHIGLALILRGLRNLPCDSGAPGKQR